MADQFEVRDGRARTMFRVDDEYLNGYSKLCGVNATLVYLCLCRHADKNQESFPSVEGMANKTGISRDSVMRGIKSLIEWNIISKERMRRPDAKWLNNTYILLDKSVWKPKPSSTQLHGAKSLTAQSQVANEGVSQVAHSDTKVSHKKEAHLEGTAKIEIISVPEKESKGDVALVSKNMFVDEWNKYTSWQGLGKKGTPSNPSVQNGLLPLARNTRDMQKALIYIRGKYSFEEFADAVKKYASEVINRKKDTGTFYLHRWTLYEFLTHKDVLTRYVNK